MTILITLLARSHDPPSIGFMRVRQWAYRNGTVEFCRDPCCNVRHLPPPKGWGDSGDSSAFRLDVEPFQIKNLPPHGLGFRV